jgi:5-methylthioadenosine/S-adenosylhomocysteine deaminase
MTTILTADFVLPIASEPIGNGAVAIEGTSIAAVGTLDEVAGIYPHATVENFGRAAILPGLVNCHSHLEITAMRGFLDPFEHDFRSWLLTLNKVRQEKLDNADIAMAALAGALEGARAGVTCFGDIGRIGTAGIEALKTAGLRGIVFQETEFSPDNCTAEQDIQKLKDKYLMLRESGTALVEAGLSPHSPYTVSRKLFEQIGEFARSEDVKLSIHAAESAEEDDLLKRGRGFFIEVYKKFGLNWDCPGRSSVQFLSETGILNSRPLLVHCVVVSDADIELISSSGSTIAHCPKSNAKFGHGYAPLEKFLDAGVPTGLGSDSVASNNLCDIFEESRFAVLAARNRPGSARFIEPREILESATLGGARALRIDDKVGSLEAGKQADIAVVSMDHIRQQPVHEVHSALVFASGSRDVVMTMVAGSPVFQNSRSTRIDENEVTERLSSAVRKMAE